MPYVGDKGIVFGAGSDSAQFIQVQTPNVGDRVILYNLKNDTKIAVPILSIGVDYYIFNTPSFQFAGFNWNIDFNFQLIPLILSLTPSGTYWVTSIIEVSHGPNGNASYDNYILSTSPSPDYCTHLGDYGRIVVKFDDIVNLASGSCLITIYEVTSSMHTYSFNPMDYLAPDSFTIYIPGTGEKYRISVYLPRTIEIKLTSGNGLSYPRDPGNISGVKAVFT